MTLIFNNGLISQTELLSFQIVGMKGLPHVDVLPYFDCATGLVIDDMHCIYEGVIPKLIKHWTKERILDKQQVSFVQPLAFVQYHAGRSIVPVFSS